MYEEFKKTVNFKVQESCDKKFCYNCKFCVKGEAVLGCGQMMFGTVSRFCCCDLWEKCCGEGIF